MVNTRLEIEGLDYPITTQLPINTTYALADIREPDKRNATFTKTITLNATGELNKFFESIYHANIATQTFNVNKKSKCKYYANDMLVLQGSLQLLRIRITPDNNMVYECNILGDQGSLFVDIGDKELTDLDFSIYDHQYSRTNIMNSWGGTCVVSGTPTSLSTGQGYYYPFVNRNGDDVNFYPTDFMPCFFVKEYIEKIITNAGYTIASSSIMNSSHFRKLIVYPNIDAVPLSQAQLDARQFYVNKTTATTLSAPPAYTLIKHNNESTPYFDPSNIYDGTTGLATIPENGNYNVVGTVKVKIWFTHTDPSVVKAASGSDFVVFSAAFKSTNGGTSYSLLNSSPGVNKSFSLSSPLLAGSSNAQFVVGQYVSGEQALNVGDILKHMVTYTIPSLTYYNSSNTVVSTGTGTFFCEAQGGSDTAFYCLATSKMVTENNTILANSALPIKIKQKDFLKSIIQAYNLYIDVDKNDPKKLTIETYDDFYGIGVVNWENKIDRDKEIVVNPAGLLDGKRYIFNYKDDKDYWNKKYSDTYSESFGTEIVNVDNDFIKSDKTTQLIFSPTPNVANYDLGIAMPKIYEDTGSGIRKITPNIRLLLCNGTKQTAYPYNFKSNYASMLVTYDYGYAGHTDDPFSPTMDINFGIPKEVYYSYVNASFTTNNLYNRFWKHYIENITSRDSKLMIAYLWLNPSDINKFSFRYKYFIDGSYYIVNKIDGYDPMNQQSTKVELIKLLEASVFTPTNISLYNAPSIPTGGEVFRVSAVNSQNTAKLSVKQDLSGLLMSQGPDSNVSVISTLAANSTYFLSSTPGLVYISYDLGGYNLRIYPSSGTISGSANINITTGSGIVIYNDPGKDSKIIAQL